MLPCLESLRDLVEAWCQTDRIRISPSTGRLMGMVPGDHFVFRCESFKVTARTVRQTGTGFELVFHVTSSLGDGRLVVVHDAATDTTAGELSVPTLSVAVFDGDFVVLKDIH